MIRFVRTLAILAIIAANSSVSSAGISSNHDGSVVLFNYGYSIIRWRQGVGADLAGLVRSNPLPVAIPGVTPLPQGSGYYMLEFPQVDADGTEYRFSGRQTCQSRCSVFSYSEWQTTEVDRSGTEKKLGGRRLTSPNGEFVHSSNLYHPATGGNVSVSLRQSPANGSELTLLWSLNVSTAVLSGRVVANNGVAMVRPNGSPLRIVSTLGATLGEFPADTLNAGIQADGTAAYYSVGNEVRKWTLSTARHETVYRANGVINRLEFSDDASVFAAFISASSEDTDSNSSAGSAPVVIRGGAVIQTLSAYPRTVDMTFSGDGRVLFLQDCDARVYRLVRTESGTFAPTGEIPWAPVLERNISGVPGSRIAPTIVGFEINQDFSLKMGGFEAPQFFYGSATVVRSQVPWELSDLPPGESVKVELKPAGGLPSVTALTVEPPKPVFESRYHSDWNSFVTFGDPALIGEMVYVNTLGLGPVDHPVPTGERTALELLSRPVLNFECQTPAGAPVPIEDVRLAFNEIGMYRIAFINPGANGRDSSGRSTFTMNCRVGSGEATTLQLPSLPLGN